MPELLSWIYVDLNSFFASCEQQENPKLRGKPVAVVAVMTDTTSCIAASYEAKRYGVKTGTRVTEARAMCPGIQFIEADHEIYTKYHHKIKEAVESCIPVDGVMSIDEFSARLTGSQRTEEKARAIGEQIRQKIKDTVGVAITCSIGIATSRFLAKVATDMQKPNGMTVIKKSDLPGKLYSLVLRDLPGVGEKMEQKLNAKGIHSIQKLLSLNKDQMTSLWGGIWGTRMFLWLKGEEVDLPASKTYSISHQHVLPPEKRSSAGALDIGKKLLSKLAIRLRKTGSFTRKMTVHVKFTGNFEQSWERTDYFDELRDTVSLNHKLTKLWEEFPERSTPLRVDIVFSDLIQQDSHQFSFFENPRLDKLASVMDKINAKHGRDKIHLGATHDQEEAAPTRIAFRRIPDLDEF